MFREHELVHKMIERYGISKDELQAVLEDREELEEKYGKAIRLLGQFEDEALEEVADFNEIKEE